MDIRKHVLDCERCGQKHYVDIDFDKLTQRQLDRIDPVFNFTCPNLALMYLVTNYALDTRANALKYDTDKTIINFLRAGWGESNFDIKLSRFKKLDLTLLGIPDEYYFLLQEIISSYSCGYFYPSMTAAGALGERILNRLIIKTKKYFKTSIEYKKIYNKDSFDNWDLPIGILKEWGIISKNITEAYYELKKYRNDALHYNNG